MLLITSAAYITPGLISEFGKLPPSFLPVQNKRLYEHQVKLAQEGTFVVLSLPSSYKLPIYDEQRLSKLGVKVVFVPDGIKLGQSIVYVLNVLGRYDEPLEILHGDTLFSQIPKENDVLAVAKAEDGYDWTVVEQNENLIFSGYFSFSNQSLFIKKVTESGYSFIGGIRKYSEEITTKYEQLPNWLDFSLVNTYYRSISKMTTQRCFNSMNVSRYSVRKSSKDKRKMKAESNWLLSLPVAMKHYVPAVWDFGEEEDKGYYEIEYYFLSSLASLFVFGENPTYVWEEIIDACVEYLNDEYLFKPQNSMVIASQNNQLYGIKTMNRLEEYARQSGISLDAEWRINGVQTPSLRDIVNEVDSHITKDDMRFASLMHGDPCFSNILYDFKSKSIKVIDPRGVDVDGNLSVFGDFRYDVGKLAHSVLGMYDFIIGGMFEYKEVSRYDIYLNFRETSKLNEIQEYFTKQTFGGYTLSELSTYPILINLFLSMIPLHSDHPARQHAMLANALRIYVEYKKKIK